MLLLAVNPFVSYAAAPPRIPQLAGGGSAWEFTSLDLQEGAELITTLSRTYTDQVPDFSSNPLLPSNVPQGFLGFALRGDVRMVLHFYEREAGVASISTVCVAQGDFEAAPALLRRIRGHENIVLDDLCLERQPRYRFLRAYHDEG